MIQESLEVLGERLGVGISIGGSERQAFRDDRFERGGIAGLNLRTAASRSGLRSSRSFIARAAGSPFLGRSGIWPVKSSRSTKPRE